MGETVKRRFDAKAAFGEMWFTSVEDGTKARPLPLKIAVLIT